MSTLLELIPDANKCFYTFKKHLPSFVECREHIPLNDLIADIAQVAKKLVVVSFTVGQALSFVVAVAMKRFFAFRAYEVLHMPMFSWIEHSVSLSIYLIPRSAKPRAVTTLSSMGRLQAPQIGIPILKWHLKQYNSF